MGKYDSRYKYPLDYRLLWIFGLKPRPPLFESFTFNFIREAILMAIGFFLLSYLNDHVFHVFSGTFSFSGRLFTSIFFGIFMGWRQAKIYAEIAQKQGLKWEEYKPPQVS